MVKSKTFPILAFVDASVLTFYPIVYLTITKFIFSDNSSLHLHHLQFNDTPFLELFFTPVFVIITPKLLRYFCKELLCHLKALIDSIFNDFILPNFYLLVFTGGSVSFNSASFSYYPCLSICPLLISSALSFHCWMLCYVPYNSNSRLNTTIFV